ncbi:amidohydrolase family protein [Sphingomonas sp. BIUV-7]|uniref:Amidohydrolase family protein n=1 Tax=Sphingomonas natans TaxID=3063330 RepID=A0ABT8Y809_9SPHN|nr:amidohydrolase family protein [Sphingomonas sp. BIUV-7]MDO6414461.1 amidohydrolase family protein [Sphingomonas sp. BIUV-7]
MKMEDMVLISVDDHITEPGTMYDQHLSGEALATAPKLLTLADGTNLWEYQGKKIPSVGLNAVVGRPPEEYGMEPTSFEQLRAGCYDVHERVKDMNINGMAASLNFASYPSIDGGLFIAAEDKAQALTHLRGYNDWHVDEWCGAYPGRFIPCGLLPVWDMDATVAELRRLADKGCHAVSINENPTVRKLPSIHNTYWEPLYRTAAEIGTTLCLHIGGGNASPHASMETPIEAWITTMPLAVSVGAADWLNLAALGRYPSLRIALSESGIGWIPYLMERADFSHKQHKAWTHSDSIFAGKKPSEVFRQHFTSCFIDDAFGLKNIDEIGEDNICYECDYPHSDTLWPNAPEFLWETIKHLPERQIQKITHENAMRDFTFDPFAHHKKEDLTVAALRAKAAEQGVDVSVKSSGGAAPLAAGEAQRPVTSGDIVQMFMKHAEAA